MAIPYWNCISLQISVPIAFQAIRKKGETWKNLLRQKLDSTKEMSDGSAPVIVFSIGSSRVFLAIGKLVALGIEDGFDRHPVDIKIVRPRVVEGQRYSFA